MYLFIPNFHSKHFFTEHNTKRDETCIGKKKKKKTQDFSSLSPYFSKLYRPNYYFNREQATTREEFMRPDVKSVKFQSRIIRGIIEISSLISRITKFPAGDVQRRNGRGGGKRISSRSMD